MIKRELKRNVVVTAVENDIVFQTVDVTRKFKLCGITVWESKILEDISKHEEMPVDSTGKVGFRHGSNK